jgi:TRAP-type C4-dicarboxylate transport system permease small subunit
MNAVAAAAGSVARLNDHFLLLCKYVLIGIVAVIAMIMIAAVFYRHMLGNSITWAEEGCKYLMVWLALIGAPIALRHAAHINIDLLVNIFPPRGRQAFYLFIHLVIVATMGLLLWQGWIFSQSGARQVASSFNLSMLWMYIAIPIGSALTCLVAIEHALKALVGISDPSQGLTEDHTAIVDEIRE